MTLDIARPLYENIPLYSTDSTPVEINLADNTNQWGVPPAATRAIADAVSAVTHYPAVYATGLKTLLAQYVGVTPDMIVTGCGSDDVIDSAIRAFGEPGDRLAYPDPTFHMAVTFGRMNGLIPVGVPLGRGRAGQPSLTLGLRPRPYDDALMWDANPDAFLATKARVIYLCSPNNPTGTLMTRESLEKIVARAPGLVIIDEAYAEYAGVSATDLARTSDRVLITRTLSKAFGLAGLRVGYGVAAPAVIREVEKSRGPYKVNVVAERAAIAALRDDRAWVDERVKEAVENRERLVKELSALGFSTLPSAANFVLVPSAKAVAYVQHMRTLGVGVRPYTGLRAIGDAMRVSVGPWPMMQRFLDALAQAMKVTA